MNCLIINISTVLLKAYRYFCYKKNFRRNFAEIYLVQNPDPGPEPDPDTGVFESRIRIRSKVVRIRNTEFNQGQELRF
jgi:hypothetical protein